MPDEATVLADFGYQGAFAPCVSEMAKRAGRRCPSPAEKHWLDAPSSTVGKLDEESAHTANWAFNHASSKGTKARDV